MQLHLPLILLLLIVPGLVSCSQMNFGQTSPPESAHAEAMPAPSGPTDYYYDFEDILVPKEMELQTSDSFILETPSSKSGVMVFTGRVELTSLTAFFINNMSKDGWMPCSVFKSSRTILVFEKHDRYCIINITDGRLRTLLEIWVSPRVGAGGSAQVLSPGSQTYGSSGGAYANEGRLMH